MAKPVHHTLDIYDVELHATWTPKQWRKVARRIGFDEATAPGSAGHTSFSLWVPNVGVNVPHVLLYISLADHDDTVGLVNTIAHEADHAATDILDHVGQPLASEAHAYLVGRITSWLWRHAGQG